MKKIILLMVLTSLTTCTSMPKSARDADPIQASRMYGYSNKSDAQLVVMLDSALDGGCMIRLSIDGEPAADFSNGEIAYFGITFGTHKVLAQPLAGCANSEPHLGEINVKSGDALLRRLTGTSIQPPPSHTDEKRCGAKPDHLWAPSAYPGHAARSIG
ncbi:hypothetical protein [Pseudomonas sp. RA_105y_Pfl2_P56]|uniref:hypothetical protein n=1 Tax=Pseudomonas sp. RA_105y_Pfl2_P56 TaxID=3088701 RepID=UPI0030DA4F2E